MNYSEVKKELERSIDGSSFCTLQQVVRFMGLKNPDRVKKTYLDGLDRVNGKFYFVPDVARRLCERRTG